MSHLIESAVYSAAEGAGWTGLGKAIPAEIAKDPRKIAEMVGATYNVIALPLVYQWEGKNVDAENRVARVRDDTGELLEVTSANRYHTEFRQPVDVFESFRDELAKEGLEISHAAVLDGGRKIAVCARLHDSAIITDKKGRDVTLPYVTGATGYDAKTGTNYFLTGIRTVCANTLQFGLMDAEKNGRLVRYSASQRLNKDSLKDMLADAAERVQREAEFYQSLTAARMHDTEARKYFADIIGVDLSLLGEKNADGRKVISTRSENQLNGLMAVYKSGPGAHLDTARDTLFGALNAVTRTIDHESAIRDTRKDGVNVARLTSATFGNGAQTKARAVRFATDILPGLLARPMSAADHAAADAEHDHLLATSIA